MVRKGNQMIDIKTAKPREIEAYLRETVRRYHGDVAENESNIYAHRGYYTVSFQMENVKYVEFQNFRRGDVPKIAKAIRAMK